MKYEFLQIRSKVMRSLPRRLRYTESRQTTGSPITLFILIGLFVGLQLPVVQTKLAQWATDYVTKKTGFETQIQKVTIDWTDKASFKGVKIKDKQGREMLSVELLQIDFNFLSLWDERQNIEPDGIIIRKGRLNLITQNDKMNLLEFVQAFGSSEKTMPDTTQTSAPRILIKEIEIDALFFGYDMADEASMASGLFDYNHISLANITGKIQNLKIAGDTTEMEIEGLKAVEENINFPIEKLTTFFRMTPTELRFAPLDFRFGYSALRDSVILRYESMDDLADFNNKVHLSLNFNNSVLTLDDLAIFSEELKQFRERFVIHSGKFEGKVADFDLTNLDIELGQNTRLKGDLKMKGLTEIDSTDIVLKLDNSKFWTGDVEKYVPSEAYAYFEKFGMIQIPKLAFIGRINAFDFGGKFKTNLGQIEEQFRINLDSQSYRGNFALTGFQAGVLADAQDVIQQIDIQGEIDGKGFSIDQMQTHFYSKIPSVGLKGYTYQNLEINTGIFDQIITSDFSVKDPNLKLNLHSEIDLVTEVAGLVVKLDTAFLDKLKLIDKPIFVRTAFEASIHRFNLKNIDAELTAVSTYVQNSHKGLEINDLSFKIDHQEDGNRSINFVSNLLDAKLYGQFNLEKFVADNLTLFTECLLYVENDEQKLTEYYKKKKIYPKSKYDTESYKTDFEVVLKNINPALHLFEPKLHLGRNTRLVGHFSRDFRTYATLTGVVDTVTYDESKILGSTMVFSIGKNEDEPNANIDVSLFSESQDFSESVQTEQFNAEAHVMNQKVIFQTDIDDKNSDDHINLSGTLNLLDSSAYRLNLNESTFFLIGQEWKTPDSTKITISGNEINFENMVFSDGIHLLDIEGNISENPSEKLSIKVQDLELGLFNNLLGTNITGKLNGNASLKNIYHAPIVGSMLHLSDLHYEGFKIGNLSGLLTWNNQKEALHVSADLERNGIHMVRVKGDIAPTKEDGLDLIIRLLKTDLSIAQPFTVGNVSDFEGTMSGQIVVKGEVSRPILGGEIKLEGARCRIDLLNTTYTFDDDVISLRENSIEVHNFIIFDEESDLAEVSGGIYHDGFEDFLIDIRGEMDRFQVLNTERSEEEIYYGTANMTGDFEVAGSLTDITIKANVKTEKDTELYIPLDGYADVEETEAGFIKFVEADKKSKEDSLKNTIQEDEDLRLRMKFNVDITPDAYCAVIFDENAGDIMRGRGEGSISVDIDTKGDFKMLGEIGIVEGAYNFTFMNLINKEFIVGKGSSITWTGDPFSGVLNIKALYRQLTLITPILSSIITDEQSELLNHPSLRRKYEVEVGLLVTGELLSPDIGFSIDILDYPRTISTGNQSIPLGNYIQAFQSRLKSDDQELAKQVFSIIALQRFSAENAFSSMGSSAGGSVSELLSNQLSGWLSQVDNRLEIGLDLGGFDSEALKTFQLRFSYSLLGGRMRITRDGGFTNMENETDPASIIGNWTLEYLLTKDGQFKLKMYHKNSTATFNAGLRNNSTTGTSILMTKSFNSPNELFQNQKKKKQQKLNKNQDE